MRNCMIWCVLLLVIAGTAYSAAPRPLEQGKTPQEAGAGDKTEGPPKEVTVDLGGGVKMELVLMPAGSFLMGEKTEWGWGEEPVHKVRITKPFYLGKYEVTQEQWQAVMGSNPSKFKGPKNPVEQVSWNDCQTFLGQAEREARQRGAEVRPADRGAVGIRLPGGKHDPL